MDLNRHNHQGSSYPQTKSPLRTNQTLQPQIKPNSYIQPNNALPADYDEEEEYNRRRQEGVRKQLQSQQYQQPLRSKYDSLGQPGDNNYLSQERQSLPERERVAPSTHFTLGPQIREEGPYEPPAHIKEHIANIQNDNNSLMRRLNLVLQELDRVKREKNDMLSRLQYSTKEAQEVSKMLNNEDNVDKVNKYMQDDLAYERDRNHKIKNQIKELDIFKNELIRDIRNLNEEQDHIARDNQDLSYSLQQSLTQINDLEKEAYFTQEKIRALSLSIDNSKREQIEDNADKDELDRIIQQLMAERNDLLSRLEHLTRKYDECVKEISQDRSEMEAHNKQHAKLITAKIIFQQLEVMQRQRLNEGFSEFKTYCSFDNNCHQKLAQLAKIFQKTGEYRLKIALRQWFSQALKPVQCKKQSEQQAIEIDRVSTVSKFYFKWRELYTSRLTSYDQKTKAVQLVWQKWEKEAQIETKRAFFIWKETLQRFNVKKARVKKLIWKLYFNQLSQAFNSWINHNSNLDQQVRLNLLSKNFSHKQYMTILFNKFRYQTYESKRKRQNILFHCLKSWKDYLGYQKFIMGSSLVALQFRREVDTSIVKACFDAMKQHKEKSKFEKVNAILVEDELPLIEQLAEQNDNMIVDRKFKQKQKACESVKKMMSKQLYGYFQHWKVINEDYKDKLRTTVKDKVIKLYMETIRKAFNHWRQNNSGVKLNSQEMVVEEMQQEQQALQNEVMEMQKELQNKNEQRDCSQKKSTLKCIASYEKRLVQLAVGRWRDRINELNNREDGAATIVRRLRLRFLRKAFDFYVNGVKHVKKTEKDEERCEQMKRALNERLMKKVYNSWHMFRNNHIKAKEYWHRMFLKLDLTMKSAALKKWKEKTQKKVEMELEEQQEKVVQSIDELNHQIGKLHQEETEQKNEIGQLKSTMTEQARRIIANAFARFYYTNETRGFERWKEFVAFEKRKQRLMKKYLDHMMKQQFYYVKSVFKNWILNANIQERKDQLKKEEMKVSDAQFQLELQTQSHDNTSKQLDEETKQVKEMQRVYGDRLQKSVKIITNKVLTTHFTSQRRYIFQQWREYVKREVHFIKCIENVIQKSLWQKAFKEIKQASRVEQKQRVLSSTLQKFRMKFWKRTCGNAFSIWRSGQYSIARATIQETDSQTNQAIDDYNERKATIKQANANRALRIIAGHNMRNLFQSWRNVITHFKQHRTKHEHCEQELNYFNMRNALRKWNLRKHATKVARVRMERLKEKFHRIRLRCYFNALRDQFTNTSSFVQRISNLANVFDLQGLKASFNAIKSFAKSKEFVFQKRKENSANHLEALLQGIVQRRKYQYLTDLRLRCLNKRKVDQMKQFTILFSIGNQVRHFFLKWKHQSNERSLAKEMNEEGPVREEVFEERIKYENLKCLLKDEGYEERDIAGALNQEKGRQSTLILKSVRRMQHYNEELYLKPKVFDRWKQFVHIRRLFKYWLGFAHKRGEFVKSDLYYAFDKWRNYHPQREVELRAMPKSELDKICCKNSKKLEHLAETVQDKENQLNHLNDQREALVDNLIKAQKLALTKWKNCQKATLHQAFMRWNKAAKFMKNLESTDYLRRNVKMIEELKNRIKALECDNDTLGNENEELRQFSLDGYEIAKNVQQLTSEREKLSVDLADKAQMIRKLLDENEKLNQKLRYAQDEAQSMIRTTMGSTGFKTAGTKGFPSPMTRSNKY